MLSLLSLLIATACQADLFMCRSGTGETLFTDRGCDESVKTMIQLPPFIEEDSPTGLSNSEQKAFKALRKKHQQRRSARAVAREKRRRRMVKLSAERQLKCEDAAEALTAIRIKRRSGYELAERGVLDGQQAALRKTLKSDC